MRWVEVWAAAEVASLQVNERLVPVHDQGVAVIVWGTERLPHIAALGANGSPVGPIQFHVPRSYWVFWHRALSRRRPGPRTRATARTVPTLSVVAAAGHETMDMTHKAEGRGDPIGGEQPSTPIERASGQAPNAGQREQWAREGGQWVAEAGRYDTMLQPFSDAVLAAAGLSPGERVADVGCGNGSREWLSRSGHSAPVSRRAEVIC